MPSPCTGESNLFPYCFPNPHSSSTYFRAESGRSRHPAIQVDYGRRLATALIYTNAHHFFAYRFAVFRSGYWFRWLVRFISIILQMKVRDGDDRCNPFVIDYSALHVHGFWDVLHPPSVVDSNAKVVSFWQLMKKPPVLISKSPVLCFYEWLIIKFCGQKEPPFWHLSD